MDKWIEAAKDYLVKYYGLDSTFAKHIAGLLAEFYRRGLSPRITRGWSSPDHQEALQKQWDSGNRNGLRVRPASSSKHTETSWGRPAATAIDIVTSDDRLAGQIAKSLGIGSGEYFHEPDPGHFYLA